MTIEYGNAKLTANQYAKKMIMEKVAQTAVMVEEDYYHDLTEKQKQEVLGYIAKREQAIRNLLGMDKIDSMIYGD